VYAPQWIQARRGLSRPDMTYNKMKAIAKSQMPDYRKKSLSDITINTGRGERHSLQCLKKLKEDLLRNT
jgi:dephospho-CoA kinase